MLRNCHISLLLSVFLTFFTGCANPHFFPQVRPLFPGLDETKTPASAKLHLAQAKVDFQLALHGQKPRYSCCVETSPGSDSKVFVGKGYRLTMVNKNSVGSHEVGPCVLIDSSITGGKPYRYSQIEDLLRD